MYSRAVSAPVGNAKVDTTNFDDTLFEPDELLEAIGCGPDMKSDRNKFSYRPQRLRRSRSASNMMLDANNAFGEVLNSLDAVDEDLFEPLPITSSVDVQGLDEDVNNFSFRNMDHELNNRKKRGRTRSLLRRSNSFESLFDKKKAFKPLTAFMQPSKRQPSFIRRSNIPDFSISSLDIDFDESTKTINFEEESGTVVSSFEGLDIVLLKDCKTLMADKIILGNNRLRILLQLERGRFLVLSHKDRQKTASDLVCTITEDWKGRVLMRNNSSYTVLSHKEASDAMFSLLLHGDSTGTSSIRESPSVLMPHAENGSSVSSRQTSTSLLKAPPLPAFLQNASKEILGSIKKKCASEMTAKERQAAAIDALKERNKSRQLAKEKNKSTD